MAQPGPSDGLLAQGRNGADPPALPLPEWQIPVVTGYVAPWYRRGRVVLSPKKQRDTVVVQMDFGAYIGTGNSISQVGSYQELYAGEDYTNPSLQITSPQVNGTIVSYVLSGGVIGCIYLLSFFVNDGQLQEAQMSGYLVIVPDII